MKTWWIVAICGLAVVTISAWFATQRSSSLARHTTMPDSVDFNFHIRPILSDRCFKCHGPDARQRKANLRLDTEEGAFAALKDNPGAHVIVAGKPQLSEVFIRVATTDTSLVMPPVSSNLKLSAFEIDLIGRWIEQGAKYRKHWAFIPPAAARVPETGEDWATNEIDRFTYAAMGEKGLEPNAEADKERLLKRVYLDITGLPPSLKDQEAFLNNSAPDAYEKTVDALLANPHYGEKMAVSWLDVARYADTHGYQDDGLRTMWPWRDWVIHAFNENYPYDKFITWQLAGDLMPQPTKEMLLATGFNRNHKITQEGGIIDEEYRIEYVTDRTNTFGKAFLALTLECAKCHDHKYDPISQKEYFSTFAFFNQVQEKGMVGDIFTGGPADPPRIAISNKDVQGILNFINKKDSANVNVMVMHDSATWTRPTYTLRRGVYDAPDERVTFNTPAAILPFDTTRYARNRLGLAQWLTSPQHPLTARVWVNRVWQEFFGRGLVKTAGDFGMQGELPSHPQLLDWLAVDFMAHGWDIKRLVKQIVMSSTYRQLSVVSPGKLAADPENIYLARAPRLRLTAELARDHVLATSGLLVDEIGGPSVKPYQPKGIWEVATSGRGLTKYYQDHGDNLYRRGMYTFIKRTVPPPALLVFDGSSRDQCEVKRARTNTPLQALVMMNDPQVNEAARVLAETLMTESTSMDDKIAKAFRTVLCRQGTPAELAILKTYFDNEQTQLKIHAQATDALIKAGEYKHRPVKDTTALAALIEVVMTLYNLEEAIVRS